MTGLGTPAAPVLETERLVLRGWRPNDFDAYSAMVSDAETSRYITRRQRPYTPSESWAEMAFFIGHWQMLGYGMFVVEERSSGTFVGRVGLLRPLGWPGTELAWALASNARGQGYATEAARAVAVWSFDTIQQQSLVSLIHPENQPSERVAHRLGARPTKEFFSPLGEACRVWRLDAVSKSPTSAAERSAGSA